MSYHGINAPAILTVSIGKFAGVGGLEDVRVGVSSDKGRIPAPSRNQMSVGQGWVIHCTD